MQEKSSERNDAQKDSLSEELVSYQNRLKMALKAAKICIFEVDIKRQLYTFFENAEDIFGVLGSEILAAVQHYSKLSPEEYRKAVSAYFSHPGDDLVITAAFREVLAGRTASYEARMKAGETEFKWCKIDVAPILTEGQPTKMVGVITDVSELKKEKEELEQRANIDNFTHLYHKHYTETLITRILMRYPYQKHAFIFLDLDNFKQINDTYGHNAGDQVLSGVAAHLKTIFRATDVVGRFGGDEFVVFLRDIPSRDFLLQKLAQLQEGAERENNVTKSIGISLYPEHGTSFETLFRKADKALYQAKKEKNTYTIYEEPKR